MVAKKNKELAGDEGSLEQNAFKALEQQASDKGFTFGQED